MPDRHLLCAAASVLAVAIAATPAWARQASPAAASAPEAPAATAAAATDQPAQDRSDVIVTGAKQTRSATAITGVEIRLFGFER